MDDCELFLCSGVTHLKDSFEAKGFGVHTSSMNYDGKRFFPNADLYTRLEKIKDIGGKRVCIVQSGGLPSETESEKFQVADRFFEVLQVLDVLSGPMEVERDGELFKRRELKGPSEIALIYTYLPFSKQDHAYETGEANSAKMALEIPLRMGAARVAAVDPHPPLEYKWVADLLSEKKYEMLTLMPRLLEKAKRSFDMKEPMVLSPPGKAKFKEAETLDLKKKRLDSYTVMFEGSMDVKGRDIILADDLVLSGSTLIKTREKLLEMGANEVVCCVPHTLPLSKGEEKLRMLVEKLEGKFITSNTVATSTFAKDEKLVDVTDLISEWLKS
jgi:phosphoribosylpyrophosphate synthetase